MPFHTFSTFAPFTPLACPVLVLALAVLFTKLWVTDFSHGVARQLSHLGIDPGTSHRLGGSWFLQAVRRPRNLLWALLAGFAWIALVVAVGRLRG